MKLQRREKTLAYATGGLLAVLAAYFLLFGFESRSSTELTADLQNLKPEVLTKLAHWRPKTSVTKN